MYVHTHRDKVIIETQKNWGLHRHLNMYVCVPGNKVIIEMQKLGTT